MLAGASAVCAHACGFLLVVILFFPIQNMGAYCGLEGALSPLPASNRASADVLPTPKLLEIL